MKIRVEIDDKELKTMLKERLREKISDLIIQDKDINIEVMSKQNYREHDWEKGDVRCWIEINTYSQSVL